MTEIYTKKELDAKAEAALMRFVTPIRDKDNLIYMLDYISKVINDINIGEEIYEKATEFINTEETYVMGISCCRIYDDMCVNIIFKDKSATSFKLDDPNGVLTYVYNFNADWCSELGYGFYERKGSSYHRVG